MAKMIWIAASICGCVVAAPWFADIAEDREHVVSVVGMEPVYGLPPHEYPQTNPVVGEVRPGQSLKVLRVRYGKDFEALRVELPNGQIGWVLSGGGVRVVSRGSWRDG